MGHFKCYAHVELLARCMLYVEGIGPERGEEVSLDPIVWN